jgi:RNA 2',3'-cyclic 3'-phosphodiesterase
MRVFIGIDLPKEIKEYLYDISTHFLDIKGKIKYVSKENFHITLKFLDEVNEQTLNNLILALDKITYKEMNLKLERLGFFPNERHFKVLWLGISPEEEIFDIHKIVDFSLSKYFTVEKNFLGHITIARINFVEQKNRFIEISKKINIEKKEFKVNSFKLFKSTLVPSGPIYEVIKEFVFVK